MDTLAFAAYELRRYTAAMGISPQVDFKVDADIFDSTRFFRFDARYDDAFMIEIKNGTGHITATNERAVLLGVYHFLKTQGCRYLKPGREAIKGLVKHKLIDVLGAAGHADDVL